MRERLRMIVRRLAGLSGSGVAPPTVEVLPHCGTMQSPHSPAKRTTADTSSVEAARTSARARLGGDGVSLGTLRRFHPEQ